MKVVTAAQMREIDRRTVEEHEIPAIELMELAGAAIAEATTDFLEPKDTVLVLCGRGNNGGDGFVAARHLERFGYRVTVIAVEGTANLSETAARAQKLLGQTPVRVQTLESVEDLKPLLDTADVVIDAMLGTGAKAPLRSPYDAIVELVNASLLPVVAADIPTGLDADHGEDALFIHAARTVTIGLPKRGMLTDAGRRACGQVIVEPIAFPPEFLNSHDLQDETLTLAEAAALLPPRPVDGHKGTFGLVAVFAGTAAMPGASVLCGTGALRSGVGLVRMVVPGANRVIAAQSLPEALLAPVGGPGQETLGKVNDSQWKAAVAKATAIVFGPGCGTAPAVGEALEQVLRDFDSPFLLDADGLNLLAEREDLRSRLRQNCILTPHPGEAARLLGCEIGDVQSDRWQAVRNLAVKFQCIVLLKGFGSLVARPDGLVRHIGAGNSALARGGSGDVLSGVIGGLLAQGMEPFDAASLGLFVCGLAADILVRDQSARGLRTIELADALPRAFRELENAAREAAR